MKYQGSQSLSFLSLNAPLVLSLFYEVDYELDPPQVSNTPGSSSKFQIWILDPYFPALPKAIIRFFSRFFSMLASSGLDCIVWHNSVKFLPMVKQIFRVWLGLVKISMAKFYISYCIDTWYGMVGHCTGMALYGMAL